jgi:hypothetical protein
MAYEPAWRYKGMGHVGGGPALKQGLLSHGGNSRTIFAGDVVPQTTQERGVAVTSEGGDIETFVYGPQVPNAQTSVGYQPLNKAIDGSTLIGYECWPLEEDGFKLDDQPTYVGDEFPDGGRSTLTCQVGPQIGAGIAMILGDEIAWRFAAQERREYHNPAREPPDWIEILAWHAYQAPGSGTTENYLHACIVGDPTVPMEPWSQDESAFIVHGTFWMQPFDGAADVLITGNKPSGPFGSDRRGTVWQAFHINIYELWGEPIPTGGPPPVQMPPGPGVSQGLVRRAPVPRLPWTAK